jgi:alpha-soluble NSF attachment protein
MCVIKQAVVAACEENNPEAYSEAVRDFDAVSRLDAWHTSLLLRIKKGIEGDSDLR